MAQDPWAVVKSEPVPADDPWAVVSSHEPPPDDKAGPVSRFAGDLASGLSPIGMVKGAYNMVRHPYDTFIAPADRNLTKIPSAIREGRFTDAANALAGSIPVIGPASEDISDQWKGGDVAGAAGKLTALLIAPRVYGAVGRGFKAAGNIGAKAGIEAPAAVREIALRERALPGLIRSGETRVNARLAGAESNANSALSGSTAQVSPNRVTYSPQTFDALQQRFNARPGVEAARDVAANAQTQLRGSSGAPDVFKMAAGGFKNTTGQSTPAALMERAISNNAVREIGRVEPSAAGAVSRYGDLQQVAEAYGHGTPHTGPGMTPTMAARIAIASGHRIASPLAQGTYNVGRGISALSPEVIRALILEGLLTDEPQK